MWILHHGVFSSSVLATVGRPNKLFSMGNSQKSANSRWTSTAENTYHWIICRCYYCHPQFPFHSKVHCLPPFFQLAVEIFQKRPRILTQSNLARILPLKAPSPVSNNNSIGVDMPTQWEIDSMIGQKWFDRLESLINQLKSYWVEKPSQVGAWEFP